MCSSCAGVYPPTLPSTDDEAMKPVDQEWRKKNEHMKRVTQKPFTLSLYVYLDDAMTLFFCGKKLSRLITRA